MGDPSRSGSTAAFYNILGIPKTASLTDISKAYKSLVMKWHPDRNPSNKEEAEARIRGINEAYRVLSTRKREEENAIPDEPTTPVASIPTNTKSADESFFSRLSRSASRRSKTPLRSLSRNASRRSKTPTPLSTDFLRTAAGGTPTTPRTPTGVVTRGRSATPIIYSQSTVKRKPQPVEKRTGVHTGGAVPWRMIIQEEEILKIIIKPGWKKGTKITFEGKGDERPGMYPADIIFVIDEKRHPIFKREGDDLELGVEVPLVQALAGCTITVPVLGGEKMTLSFDDILYPGYEKLIPGQGMPKQKEQGRRGDLRLKFLVNFPSELSDEQRSNVVSILNESS
ncbi:HSP40/DnaJ peptide-binding protein [Actinidia rufa]|uniref:HSP40/DnaJ peptide-binding protein n=1 Tax=Actinidia rufa TaxID=165716 RepID=A0A7J0EQE3_9ERIC|nr:HSP40/DnaJ peptide-binding protein [Actinidia rufa]